MASPGFALTTPHTGPQLISPGLGLLGGGVRVRVNLPAFCDACHKWIGQPFDRDNPNSLKTWVLADVQSSPKIKDLKERVLSLHNGVLGHSGTFFLDGRSIFDHESTTILRENDELTLVFPNVTDSDQRGICSCSTSLAGDRRGRKRAKGVQRNTTASKRKRSGQTGTDETKITQTQESKKSTESSDSDDSSSDVDSDADSGSDDSRISKQCDSDSNNNDDTSDDSSDNTSGSSSEEDSSDSGSSSSGSNSAIRDAAHDKTSSSDSDSDTSESDSSDSDSSDSDISDGKSKNARNSSAKKIASTSSVTENPTVLPANKRTRRRRRRRRSRRGKKPKSDAECNHPTPAPVAAASAAVTTDAHPAPPAKKVHVTPHAPPGILDTSSATTTSKGTAGGALRSAVTNDSTKHSNVRAAGRTREKTGPKVAPKNSQKAVVLKDTAAKDTAKNADSNPTATHDPCALMESRVTINFEQYPPLSMQSACLVRVGCVLAFKQLVMSESYTPEVSDWKVGRVTHIFDPDTPSQGYILTLATWCRGEQRPLGDGEGFGFRKFELEEPEEPSAIDFEGDSSSTLTINHSDMTDARAVSMTMA